MTFSPTPGTWMTLQGAAVVIALVIFHARATNARLRAPFAIAVAAAPLGAIGVDLALRLLGWALGGAQGSMPTELGATSFGALGATCVVLAMLAPSRGFAPLAALDRATPAITALIAVGRLGCLAVGCEHGKPTSLPWAVRYAGDAPAVAEHQRHGLVDADAMLSLPVHPTAGYEIVVAVGALVSALLMPQRGQGRDGDVFVRGATIWCFGRAAIELTRDDPTRGALGPFTTGQLLALACWLVVLEARRRSEPGAPIVEV